MSIPSAKFQQGDVYILFDYEEVRFRFDSKTKKFFCKFYDETEESEVHYSAELLNEARLSGVEISREEYEKNGPPE